MGVISSCHGVDFFKNIPPFLQFCEIFCTELDTEVLDRDL